MILPANAVRGVRPDWEIDLYPPKAVDIGSGPGGEITAVRGLRHLDYDLLVMQRIGTPVSVKFVQWATERGIAVSIDSDDALWAIDKDNQAWRAWNGAQNHWRYMDDATAWADLSTVTTAHLGTRYGKHGRVEVIPNFVPGEVFDYESPGRFDERVSIGWTGFTRTHPGDLTVVGDAMQRVLAETEAVARVIGDAEGAMRDWGIHSIESIPPLVLGPDYFQGISLLDIGVVPLRDSTFNRCKSNLKALEMSAMGLPVVCTPTPANRLLAKDVPLLLADTPDEWHEHLTRLVNDPEEREWRGRAAQDAVRAGWTIEANAERWALAWERAVNRRVRLSA